MPNTSIAIESFLMMWSHPTSIHVRTGIALVVNGDCFESQTRIMYGRTSCCKTRRINKQIINLNSMGAELGFIEIYLVLLASIAGAAVKLVDGVSVAKRSCGE